MIIAGINVTIKDVAKIVASESTCFSELADNGMIEPDEDGDYFGDIRLQVVDGNYKIQSGDPQFDQDHRGYWGHTVIWPHMTVSECIETARTLIELAADHAAEIQA